MSIERTSDLREALLSEGLERKTLATERSSVLLRHEPDLHRNISYRPLEIVPFIRDCIRRSEAHALALMEGRTSDQLRGEIAERIVADGLSKYGKVEKLAVRREGDGRVTADFKVTLLQTLRVGRVEFQPGKIVIVEVKHGRVDYCIAQLRYVDSHARRQMAETVARERADGAICVLPREMQQHRAEFEAIRASIHQHEGGRTLVWMGLPDAGAIHRAAQTCRAEISVVR